ncbi:MAG TPA: hypothetical protein VI451_18305 [Anaerolineales bacterium]|nr:hypothetical protein [Anaerolineales bacterium]
MNYLTQRLEDQQVPVNKIVVEGRDSFTVAVTILSTGDQETSPDDSAYIHTIQREVTLALREGYEISELTIKILSVATQELLFWAKFPVKNDIDFLGFVEKDSSSGDQDMLIKTTVEKDLDLYGLTISEILVSSEENGKTLTLNLSAMDLNVANVSLPYFMPELQAFLEAHNAEGDFRIAVCKVFLTDQEGKLLLRYTLDLQLYQENWWMEGGVTQDWFPHPPEE